ncbi:transglutaminase [Spirochaetia bacterium]|nr:transglutaminase [Spirochaetia bacterium]
MSGASDRKPAKAFALALRSAALFIILCQFRLLAGDLADTPVFIATLVCAFAAALALAGKGLAAIPAMITLGIIPWAARLIVAFPRIFAPGPSPVLDGLLLNLDRNNFVSLPSFYWAAFSTYFSIRSRNFLRGDIVAGIVLLLGIFSIVGTADIGLYRWPIVMIGLFAIVGFMQIIALMFSMPPEIALRKKESITATVILFLLILAGGVLFIGPSQERAVERGGGLLEPKLFSFDFSQFLRLESEISMNDDLVLIVRKDYEDTHILLRRYVLSGYNRKQGFFRLEDLDERTHPQRLPDRPTHFAEAESRLSPETSAGTEENSRAFRITDQEYYLVNFDSSAFIGMNEPLSATPFESWDSSSFSSVYAVQSRTSEALPFELISAAQWPPSAENLRLSPEEYRIYTEYGDDQRLKAYAEEISGGYDEYWDKVQSIYDWLKYGDYRYSLKPGIAPDGDQLSYFLFNSKKGYCSYYAFAFTLLLRSMGIPARVGAGFFIDPQTNTFDYYPVRSDMAHAWVEVFYPGYGWIEYDPTTNNLAEGEEFRFSSGVPPELFERLMKEILENHSRLNPKEGVEENTAVSNLGVLANSIQRFLRKNWPPMLLFVLGVLWLLIRCGLLFAFRLGAHPRKKAVRLWAHIKRRLALAGYKRHPRESEAEWAQKMDPLFAGIYTLYQGMSAARFAQEYSQDDLKLLWENYRSFTAIYRRQVSGGRRFLAWIIPPLAMVLSAGGNSAGKNGGSLILLIVLLFCLNGDGIGAQDADDTQPGQPLTGEDAGSDNLFSSAQDAEEAEFWERAIELYNQGIALYPDDIRFPWALGNVYYFRGLFGLAWDEYRKAERIQPWDPEILYRLSRTAGYLNRDTVSVDYLERLLEITPDDREAIGSLGWMYYKVHRQSDGERLLTSALERFGNDSDYAMTLGTINSDMFRYDEGKKWYLAAIADAEARQDQTFEAVAHYNLSILENRFYCFALAFERTNASINAQNRAPGRLARGEMYLRQLDFKRTLADYEAAYEIDNSPLSKLNLAQLHQISGRLEEARLYAEDCLKGNDLSWMLNYGINPVRYRRDIHEILYKTYGGLEKTERFLPWAHPGDKIRSGFRRLSWSFKAAVHRKYFQKYSLLSADSYGQEHLDALIQYYRAFESYPRRSLTYLRQAREFETSLTTEAEPSYDLEEGRLMKKRALTEAALENFDPLWERDMIGEAYVELARRTRGAAHQDAVEKLFALNRGALRQEGLSLPVHLGYMFNTETAAGPGGPADPRAIRALKPITRALKKAGIRDTGVAADTAGTGAGAAGGVAAPGLDRFTLTLEMQARGEAGGWNILCELYDGGRGTTVLRRSIPLASASRKDISAFARALGDAVFVEN